MNFLIIKFSNTNFLNRNNIYIDQKMIPFISGTLSKFISLTVLYPLSTLKVRVQEN